MKDISYIGEQLLPVVAYGDATGLPFETLTSQQIPAISGLHSVGGNEYVGSYPKGTWSDDTHLSIAVSRSLIDADGFSILSQAASHITAFKHIPIGVTNNPDFIPAIQTNTSKTGWGGSTKRAVERLVKGQSPAHSGERGGAGNGVVMKLAPLALWHYLRRVPKNQRDNENKALTRMTHLSDEAIVASALHEEVLRMLLKTDATDFNAKRFLTTTAAIAERYETQYRTNAVLSQRLSHLALSYSDGGVAVEAINAVAQGGGFYVPETLAMVYGNFANENNFPGSVYRVIELGGDTDSTSSLTAAMSLFLHGSIDTPSDYEQTFDFPRLKRISAELIRCALKN